MHEEQEYQSSKVMEREFHWCSIAQVKDQQGSAEAELRFPYWSFTKTVIAICALTLAERGVIQLDSLIDGQPYTLRQLLRHTSGLADYGQIIDYHRDVASNSLPWPRDKLLAAVLAQGQLFSPGQGWSYSNTGYMLAREHIEKASGKDFASLVNEIIVLPLGLRHVEFATLPHQFAKLHWKAAALYHPGWVYHGCLTGTPTEAAKILHALFSGKLLGEESLQQMLICTPLGGAIPGRPWRECGYALGLMSGTVEGLGRVIGHSGAGPFCVNAVYHFPDRADPVTVACFTDGNDEGIAEFFATRLAENSFYSNS